MPPKKKVQSTPTYKFPDNFVKLSENLTKQFYRPEPEIIIEDQIVVIPNAFSKDLCDELIKSFETNLKLETTPLIKSRDYAARFNDRISLTDFESADVLWKYLQDLLLLKSEYDEDDEETMLLEDYFGQGCGLNPQLRIYRYKKGHHFGKHYDESVTCLREENGTGKGRTKWTLLIYLTGDEEFDGGATIFYPDYRGAKPLSIHPSKGMALFHKHGDDCLKHEAEIVKEGQKWVLRSDVMYPL
ncbi:hypothetical protein DFJ63DRAFT_332548 [Scheffersomyces coipomensis]|uniref:uncharacterized protein n=1 Tax=Scheffersomyces coipomensis TaxID=1788519 RepID=UPI00315DBFB0